MQNNKIGFVSLGCPKALVDSERILTQLKALGYELGADYNNAGVVIINTCGFVKEAIQESLDTIHEAMALNGRVLVTGCLGTQKELLLKNFPQILHISPAHAYEEVVQAVQKFLPISENPFTQLIPPQGLKLTPRHYAYLKISEGCNHKCTFCIIPTMRGKLQSYALDKILTEATNLKKAGVKELLVISQDTSAYGVDKKYPMINWKDKTLKSNFYNLCDALGELGIWIRLHYVYPYPHVDDIIPLMTSKKILPYLDIPLQHANKRILKAMKRPANMENTIERIKLWRSICPEITIRSTFIVGFPGETPDEFEELLEFLKIAQLDRVGCFKYSNVDGALANQLNNHISEDIKEERFDRFMSLQSQISLEKLRQKIGSTQTVLIDGENEKYVIARSEADAPEIDGLVYLPKTSNFKVGDFATVTIKDSDHYDLYAHWSVQKSH